MDKTRRPQASSSALTLSTASYNPRVQEWNSSAYHRVSEPQFEWGSRMLSRIHFKGDETVMDAGCGTGRLTAELLDRLPRGHVIAVDISANMLRAAMSHLTPRFGAHVSFLQADLQNLSLEEVVDGIISTAAFHWIPDHDRLFTNMFRALRPGGWLIAQCGGSGNLERLRQRVRATTRSRKFAGFFRGWNDPWNFADPKVITEVLQRIGFVDVSTQLEPAPTTFADAQHLREYLATVSLHRHLAQFPDERLKGLFLDAIVHPYSADDPPFTLDYWRLNISAARPAITN
jgi:trans-aconitate 2-methyltransferase